MLPCLRARHTTSHTAASAKPVTAAQAATLTTVIVTVIAASLFSSAGSEARWTHRRGNGQDLCLASPPIEAEKRGRERCERRDDRVHCDTEPHATHARAAPGLECACTDRHTHRGYPYHYEQAEDVRAVVAGQSPAAPQCALDAAALDR